MKKSHSHKQNDEKAYKTRKDIRGRNKENRKKYEHKLIEELRVDHCIANDEFVTGRP